MKFTLRPATQADYDFLYRVKVACLRPYVAATWGWDEAFQRAHFADHFNPQRSQIVVVNGQDVGELALEEREGELFVAGIYILPDHQNQGLGTALLTQIMEQARSEGKVTGLQVLQVNRGARRLYERLGFAVVAETETHLTMQAE